MIVTKRVMEVQPIYPDQAVGVTMNATLSNARLPPCCHAFNHHCCDRCMDKPSELRGTLRYPVCCTIYIQYKVCAGVKYDCESQDERKLLRKLRRPHPDSGMTSNDFTL